MSRLAPHLLGGPILTVASSRDPCPSLSRSHARILCLSVPDLRDILPRATCMSTPWPKSGQGCLGWGCAGWGVHRQVWGPLQCRPGGGNKEQGDRLPAGALAGILTWAQLKPQWRNFGCALEKIVRLAPILHLISSEPLQGASVTISALQATKTGYGNGLAQVRSPGCCAQCCIAAQCWVSVRAQEAGSCPVHPPSPTAWSPAGSYIV